MVVTWLPCAVTIGITQVRSGSPSTCMVQAPQAPTPQPNLLPVRPRFSRTTQSNGTSSGPSNSTGLPLTKNFTDRSEEHTSELQSLRHLVCRLLLEKKNIKR